MIRVMEGLHGVLGKLFGKDRGNVVVGSKVIEAPGGQVEDKILVGDNTVVSDADPDAPVVIKGNRMFGRTKITIR
jgi:hypothetical protein